MVHHGANLVRASGGDLSARQRPTPLVGAGSRRSASEEPRGALFLKVNESLGDASAGGVEPHPSSTHQPILPPVQDQTGLVKALSNLLIRSRGSGAGLQRFLPLLATVDFSSQSPEHVLGVITDQVKLTAERFVARNVLNTSISRHIHRTPRSPSPAGTAANHHVDGWIGRCQKPQPRPPLPVRLAGRKDVEPHLAVCRAQPCERREVQWWAPELDDDDAMFMPGWR